MGGKSRCHGNKNSNNYVHIESTLKLAKYEITSTLTPDWGLVNEVKGLENWSKASFYRMSLPIVNERSQIWPKLSVALFSPWTVLTVEILIRMVTVCFLSFVLQTIDNTSFLTLSLWIWSGPVPFVSVFARCPNFVHVLWISHLIGSWKEFSIVCGVQFL